MFFSYLETQHYFVLIVCSISTIFNYFQKLSVKTKLLKKIIKMHNAHVSMQRQSGRHRNTFVFEEEYKLAFLN